MSNFIGATLSAIIAIIYLQLYFEIQNSIERPMSSIAILNDFVLAIGIDLIVYLAQVGHIIG